MDTVFKVRWESGEKLFHASSEKEARSHAAEYLSQPENMKVEPDTIRREEFAKQD
jgi:hypothetical protein